MNVLPPSLSGSSRTGSYGRDRDYSRGSSGSGSYGGGSGGYGGSSGGSRWDFSYSGRKSSFDSRDLMPFQKDFYKEHPNVTARTSVSLLV